MTAGRMRRSATLFVGSTPSTSTKVKKAFSNLSISSAMPAVLPPAHTTALLSSRLIRAPYGLHPRLEGAPGEGTVADTVPPLKHQLRLEPAPVCHRCART